MTIRQNTDLINVFMHGPPQQGRLKSTPYTLQTEHSNQPATMGTCINSSTKHLLCPIYVTVLPIYCNKHDRSIEFKVHLTHEISCSLQQKKQLEHNGTWINKKHLNVFTLSDLKLQNNTALLFLYRPVIWKYIHLKRKKLQQNQQIWSQILMYYTIFRH